MKQHKGLYRYIQDSVSIACRKIYYGVICLEQNLQYSYKFATAVLYVIPWGTQLHKMTVSGSQCDLDDIFLYKFPENVYCQ